MSNQLTVRVDILIFEEENQALFHYLKESPPKKVGTRARRLMEMGLMVVDGGSLKGVISNFAQSLHVGLENMDGHEKNKMENDQQRSTSPTTPGQRYPLALADSLGDVVGMEHIEV